MHTVQLEIPLSIGLDGIDANPINPVSRAFSALLANGKPHKAHTFCFLNVVDKSILPIPPRWLGVFVHTEGDRVLFFPGLNDPIDWIGITKHRLAPSRGLFYLDHFSAEPSREMWHLTARSSKNHISGGHLRKASQDSYFWISLSMQSYRSFLPTHKRTLVIYDTPQSDTARRLKLLRQLEQPHYQVNIGNQDGSTSRPYFLHMCFILSQSSAPNYIGSEFILPIGSPYLNQPLPDSIADFKFWRNRVCLSLSWDIQIITMLLPGTISQPFTFTGFD